MHVGLTPVSNYTARSGSYPLPATLKVFGDTPNLPGLRSRAVVDPAKANLRCSISSRLAREGYTLIVSKQGLELEGGSPAGLFYGLHTLMGLMKQHGQQLPACRIDDAPVLKRRGLYLDCSRGKVPTLDALKALVQRMASWKMNELQLYIENTFAFKKHPGMHRSFSPFSAKDLAELQACCKQHFIELVPSLSSFGHFERTLSLKKYQHLGEQPGLWGYPGGTTLDCSDPEALELMAELYDEFLPCFDSPWFNACCDETWELGKGKNAARVKRRGVGPVYLDFIKKLRRLSKQHGKQLHIWSDIVLNHPACIPQVPKDIVMLNWDYYPQGLRIAQSKKFQEAGLAWIACPGSSGWRSHGARLDHSLPNVRKFALEAKRSGADGLLMTDWGDYGHRNTLGVSLSSIAFAAVQAWAPGKTPMKGFLERFASHEFPDQAKSVTRRLELLGGVENRVGYSVPFQSFTTGLMGDDLHHGLIPPRSPVYQPVPFRKDWIAEADEKALPAMIGDLKRLSSLTLKGDAWTRDFLDDLNLAVEMDRVACERIRFALGRRAGKAQNPKTLRSDYRAMIHHFENNWLRRNRTSRLEDNLKLLRAGLEEL